MRTERPPTIDPVAAARWEQRVPAESPWLHEEVARRMEDRLQWIVSQPRRWAHWAPLQGGLQAQALLAKRYPKSECFVVEAPVERAQAARKLIAKSRWNPSQWGSAKVRFEAPVEPVQMVWANMALHMASDPMDLIARWNQVLDVDGFLMFSCLGPDTLRELHGLYRAMGWAPPTHAFTDMHDWGDMLVQAGFAEPVMDMERISLSYSSPQSLLEELRGLGRNLHQGRFAGLRGRTWHQSLQDAIGRELADPAEGGRLKLTFEVIYGHAFKPKARMPVSPQSTITLQQMRGALGLNHEGKGTK
jgi:malonyl-CoA O-methyltransferase